MTKDLAKEVRADLERLGAPRQPVDPAAVKLMKPETRDRPFSREGWLFELKYDGFRVLAAGGAGEGRLSYRSGLDATRLFPEIAGALAALPFRGVILDGEAVVLDADGRPNFQKLQRRGPGARDRNAELEAARSPAVLFAFDILGCEDFDLRPLPLAARKAVLRRVLAGAVDRLRAVDSIPERGEDLYQAVVAMGLEGILAKRADSVYRAGYQPDWLRIRVDRSSELAVVGFEPVPRSRSGFRCLALAVRTSAGGWAYAGSVGTGFSHEALREIRERLEPARRPTPVVPGGPKTGMVWVQPEMVVEVRYKEWTAGGHLRQPVFLRVRDDKTVDECFRPGDEPEEESAPEPALAARPALRLTNLDKVFWPGESITKGDLLDYYRAVSSWMLPFLRDRPLVLDRYPNGITGKSFYQKDAPETAAGWLRTVAVPAGGSGKIIDFFICDDESSLLYLANLGVIPFHVWSSRAPSLDRPDWCILDLDPKTAPFAHVIAVARAIYELCEEIEMPSFIKTSGGSGLHVLLPMGGRLDHEQTRQLAELLARVIVSRQPDLATTLRSIPKRRGKVYVDALQNGRGKLLAAPYTVRPLPGAPVSTPLEWSEVDERLDVGAFNLKTVPKRLQSRKTDPLLPVLESTPDLARVLELLSKRV